MNNFKINFGDKINISKTVLAIPIMCVATHYCTYMCVVFFIYAMYDNKMNDSHNNNNNNNNNNNIVTDWTITISFNTSIKGGGEHMHKHHQCFHVGNHYKYYYMI